MQWKKQAAIIAVLCMLTLSGCMPWGEKEEPEIVKDAPKGKQKEITVIQTESDKDYIKIHPKEPSETRGYIRYGVANRADIDAMELGLMRLSKSVYTPEKYYFQQGRYITPDQLESMLARKTPDDEKKKDKNKEDNEKKNIKKLEGLNPPLAKGSNPRERASKNPEVLSYILEQDYLVKAGENEFKLGGISLAISFNQVYTDVVEDKQGKQYPVEVDLDNDKVKALAKDYAQKVLNRVRKIEGLKEIPIFISLYLESKPGSLVPGHFFSRTQVQAGQSDIDDWNPVKEEYVLFPSSKAESDHKTDYEKFFKFKDDIESYFPNSIGVIGQGFYKNGELENLTVNINIKFFDKTEVVSFSHYVASLIKEKFPFAVDVPVQVYISSIDQPEAVILKKPDKDEIFVHVYRP